MRDDLYDRYADVHVGVVALDPMDRPARDLLEVLPRVTAGDTHVVFIEGDGFTAWGEPFPEDDPGEPIHIVVRIPRPADADGDPTDVEHGGRLTMPARERYAARAREIVADLLTGHMVRDDRYRLVDYVAVDFDPTWGEDSKIVGRWA